MMAVIMQTILFEQRQNRTQHLKQRDREREKQFIFYSLNRAR